MGCNCSVEPHWGPPSSCAPEGLLACKVPAHAALALAPSRLLLLRYLGAALWWQTYLVTYAQGWWLSPSPDLLSPSCLGSNVVTQKTLCPEHTLTMEQHNCERCKAAGGLETTQTRQVSREISRCCIANTWCAPYIHLPQTTELWCPKTHMPSEQTDRRPKAGLQSRNHIVGPTL